MVLSNRQVPPESAASALQIISTATLKDCGGEESSQWEEQGVLNMAPFPRVISRLSGSKLTTLDHFHCGRGSVLFLMEQTPLNYKFAFPEGNASAKTTTCELTD